MSHTPVWFMRQAGRSLPEYRALRGDGNILESIARPDVAAEITLQPVRRYGVDAAILFSDIIVPIAAVGFGVEIRAGVGPVAEAPFREKSDLERLRRLDPAQDVPWVAETVGILVKELTVPLIGFAGGPFTLASYLVEGRPSRDHAKTKALMYTEPMLWHALLDRLADMCVDFLKVQISSGAAAVQIFDSWAGALSPSDYRQFVLPATMRICGGIAEHKVPRILFGVGTGELLGPHGRRRSRRHRCGLEGAVGDGGGTGAHRHRIPGQSRPGAVPGPVERGRVVGQDDPAGPAQGQRPHIQSRSWCAPSDRPGGSH